MKSKRLKVQISSKSIALSLIIQSSTTVLYPPVYVIWRGELDMITTDLEYWLQFCKIVEKFWLILCVCWKLLTVMTKGDKGLGPLEVSAWLSTSPAGLWLGLISGKHLPSNNVARESFYMLGRENKTFKKDRNISQLVSQSVSKSFISSTTIHSTAQSFGF